MGRRGSKLIPFLKNALFYEKYPNLIYEHIPTRAFSLNLPQKSSRLDEKCQFILQDWYRITGRVYKFNLDYTQGKQGMEAALRRSDFLRLIQSGRKKKLIYRILNDEEVRAKKLSKKALKKKAPKSDPLENVDCAPSPESSGYGSGSDVAEEGCNITSHALLHAFKHDHKYGYTNEDLPQELKNINYENPPQNEVLFKTDTLSFDQWNPLIAFDPQVENSTLNDANFNVSNGFDNVENDVQPQSSLMDVDKIDCEQIFADEDLLQYINSSGIDSFLELEELIRLNDELPPELEEYAVKNDISTQSVLDVMSFKTQICKVYECRYRQDLPEGMILLTCEPKMKEFCVSAASLDEQNSSKLIFDKETIKLMSTCLFEGLKFLSNDHILVFLKCKELV